ncbi:hypothetical protein EKO04_005174 [Ascochyta lentis]|uniref:Arca-like protein n=1 Tax=Ascochyta lentis TaxID=205686 RepID=A0A8H7MDL6_9PLEO|nr:hypothetical protein EKO04_005174 [Ascochyta lentis]
MPRVRPPPVRHPCSSAQYDSRFTDDQIWVSGRYTGRNVLGVESGLVQSTLAISPQPVLEAAEDSLADVRLLEAPSGEGETCSPDTAEQDGAIQALLHSPVHFFTPTDYAGEQSPHQYESPWTQSGVQGPSNGELAPQSLDTTQACLLRYFIDHISPWLFVPVWARHYPPLLNAIFATSSRHLCRLARYTTLEGYQYEGQHLAGLTVHSAVEYMLACIPALKEFHRIQDKEHRKLIVATAIILRQFEEIEDESDSCQPTIADGNGEVHPQVRVNFLDIINATIRSSHDEGIFDRHELLDVAYWICLRQEVYSAFTEKRSPQMLLAPEQWTSAATANKMVMHTAQVAKWLFSEQEIGEWSRLNEQQALLESNVLTQARYQPILKRQPDKAKGEVFPTIWYGSDLVVTGVQHVMIAKMVLTAEAPSLRGTHDRKAHRAGEAIVRKIILDLCGIAMHRTHCLPALVNATMGILLYGDFFTEEWERQALAAVIAKFQDLKAWPLPEGLRSFN